MRKFNSSIKNSHLHLIRLINWSWLIVVLVGVPAASSVELISLRLTSLSTAQMLTLWGLGIGATLNGAAMITVAKRARTKHIFLLWFFINASLLVFCWLLFHEYVHFKWLKDFLLWLREMFGRS